MNKTEKVYALTYALTQGIFLVEGYEKDNGGFCCPARHYQHFTRKEWTRCPKEALEMAETMREKKIASLLKHMVRVRSVKFKVPDA